MEKVKIFYAYNGFIYAPIFVAEKLKLLPELFEPTFCIGGDYKAIEGLFSQNTVEKEIYFSICDPFAGSFVEHASEQYNDNMLVIGSLISKLPIWVFNTHPDIKNIKKESDLLKHTSKIKKIISYKKGTTGYIIAKRLSELLSKSIETVEYNEEFKHNTYENLIVTADALAMNDIGINHKNVVFNYPQKGGNDINPFMFTGIHTLKSNVDNYLWMNMSLLGGLQIAIRHLSQTIIDPTIIDILRDKFSEHPSIKLKIEQGKIDECNKLIQKTCTYLFQGQEIYNGFPYANKNEWEKAWYNAKNVWEKGSKKEFSEAEMIEKPLPALLIKKNWEQEIVKNYLERNAESTKNEKQTEIATELELLRAENKLLKEKRVIDIPLINKIFTGSEVLFTLLALLFIVWLGIKTFIIDLASEQMAIPEFNEQYQHNMLMFWLSFLLIIILITTNIWTYIVLFSKWSGNPRDRDFPLGVYGVCLGFIFAIFIWFI